LSAVLAALGLVMLLLAATLLGAFKAEKLAARVSQRLAQQGDLADQFRTDVARAAAAPAAWGEWTAGPDCLILRLPGGEHVTYRWEDGRLQRSEFAGPARSTHPLALGGERVTVELLRSGPGKPASVISSAALGLVQPGGQPWNVLGSVGVASAATWADNSVLTLRLTERRGMHARQQVDISAALGGDLR